MPVTTDDNVTLHVREEGAGDACVVFSHSFLTDHRHFDPQIEALAPSHRVVAYDHRAHGASDKPLTPYDINRLVDDGIAVLEAQGVGPCHWVGLSTGGFVGMRIAKRRPDLLRSLTLMDTTAGPERRLAVLKYRAMFGMMRLFGFRPILPSLMDIMMGKSFVRDPDRADEVEMWRERFRAMAGDVDALWRFAEAIFYRDDFRPLLSDIAVPTLVIVGEEDIPTPPAAARRIADGIPEAQLAIIERAGHLSTVGNPEAVNRVLAQFLDAHAGS